MKQADSTKKSLPKGSRKRWVFTVALIFVFVAGGVLGAGLQGFFFQPSKGQIQSIAYGAAARYCFTHYELVRCEQMTLLNFEEVTYASQDGEYYGTWYALYDLGPPINANHTIAVGLDRAGRVLYTGNSGPQRVE